MSIDRPILVFVVIVWDWGIVAGFIVVVGAAVGVTVGVGLVGYFPNFFLSINIIQRIMVIQHKKPINSYKLKDTNKINYSDHKREFIFYYRAMLKF